MHSFRKYFPLLVFLMLGLMACEKPGQVGLGVLEEDIEPPEQITLQAVLSETSYRDVTGQQSPVLAGRVSDPLTGTIEATGYLDVALPFGVSGFPQDTVVRAELYLKRSYVYGDTTQSLTLQVHEITEDWDPQGATADTTLSIGPPVTAIQFLPSDSSLTIAFPETWVQERDTTLRSASFNSIFHGFALTYLDGNAVTGFDMQQSELRLFFTVDSVAYPVVRTIEGFRSLTHIERLSAPEMLPPGRILLQDGAGPYLRMDIDLNPDSLQQVMALNRADVFLYSDSLTLQAGKPAGFVRPVVSLLSLYGVQEDSSRIFIESARRDSTGAYVFASLRTSQIFQRILLGDLNIDHFQVIVPANQNTLNPVVFFNEGTLAPRVRLTGTPTSR